MPPASLSILIGLAALLLAALALWFTYRRADTRRLRMRMLATVVACAALGLLWWQPRIPYTVAAHSAIVISPLASARQVDSLQATQPARMAVLALRGEYAASDVQADAVYDDIAALRRAQPGLRVVYVVGAGLPVHVLQGLQGLRLHAVAQPQWPLQLQLPRQVVAGQPLVVSGAAPQGTTALALYDPAGRRCDSSIATSNFVLRAPYTQAGLQAYTLRHYTGSRFTSTTLPVQVLAMHPMRLVVLESAPQPETKFLKQWAAQVGHRLWVRTTISRDRYRYDGVNQAAEAWVPGPALFAQADVLVIDAEALASMPPATQWALTVAVQQGMGLLLRVDEVHYAQLAAGRHALPGYNRFAVAAPDTGVLRRSKVLATHTNTGLPAISYLPGQLLLQVQQQPLLVNERQQVLAASSQWGAGRVGISLVQGAYTWQLAGSADIYAHYWQALLQPLARRQGNRLWIEDAASVTLHQPLQVQIMGAQAAPLQVQDASGQRYALPTAPTPTGDYSATYWPQQTGWHRIVSSDSSTLWVYVHAQAPSWAWAGRYQRTRWAATQPAVQATITHAEAATHTRPLPVAWAWLLFLLAAVYLWAERKF